MLDTAYRLGDKGHDDEVDDGDGDNMEIWRRTLGKMPCESIREAELVLRAENLSAEAEELVDLRLSVEEFENFVAEKLPEMEDRIGELEDELSAAKDDLSDAKEETEEALYKVSSFEKERSALEARISELENEVLSLREQVESQNNN
jgi:chromosome segregation ATPase